MPDFRLYVILDVDICSQHGDIVEIAHKIILAGADILQLRAKDTSAGDIRKTGQAIKNLLRKSKTLFMLNDQVELAHIIGADGVHLGQEDWPIKKARRILGNDKIVGLSTHSVEEAVQAERDGADYVAIGPIFATATKPKTTPLSPKIVTKIKDKIRIPFVAIGGIKLDNLDQVLTSGAQRVAICQAIITAPDVFKATKEFRRGLWSQ